jgi:2-oxoglutarate ferredoxin oxidoreductase subunit alpha
VSGTDEHDEDGVLLSDVYTDPVRRKKMVDKRARKMDTVLDHVPAPKLEGPAEADVTLVGWGSTWGVISEAVERLNQEGISANHLQIKLGPVQCEGSHRYPRQEQEDSDHRE